MRYAVALYMSSVLGSGVLVLPGLAAQIAGPASLLAWLLLSLASYPLAYTFASLSARKPESGGVYSFRFWFPGRKRSEEHTSELQSLAYLVCRLLLEKKKKRVVAPTSYIHALKTQI